MRRRARCNGRAGRNRLEVDRRNVRIQNPALPILQSGARVEHDHAVGFADETRRAEFVQRRPRRAALRTHVDS
jgi:hypothetical protein